MPLSSAPTLLDWMALAGVWLILSLNGLLVGLGLWACATSTETGRRYGRAAGRAKCCCGIAVIFIGLWVFWSLDWSAALWTP